MDIYDALAKAEYGEVVELNGIVNCRITKGRAGSLCYDEGGIVVSGLKPVASWLIVSKKTHTTVTTESGRKVELTREDAEKLNLL